ncbi:MAG: hypothetical protein WA057_00410 [Candidatus Magasanikiibacteriota bacterium]
MKNSESYLSEIAETKTENDFEIKGNINILEKRELKRWSELLCCKEEDLIQSVLVIGNNAKIVDTYLYLNRKKVIKN